MRATVMVSEYQGLRYEDRLKMLGYTDMKVRRKKGDLIQLYKIAKGTELETGGINKDRSHTDQITKHPCRRCNQHRGKFRRMLSRPDLMASGDFRRSVY